MKITSGIKIGLIVTLFAVIIISYSSKRMSKGNDSPSEIEKDELSDVRDDLEKLRELRHDSVKSSEAQEIEITIDGTDTDGTIIDPINLWSSYETRSFAGTVRHGEKVKFIRRDGDGILLETRTGQRGWVTYFFIKEYK